MILLNNLQYLNGHLQNATHIIFVTDSICPRLYPYEEIITRVNFKCQIKKLKKVPSLQNYSFYLLKKTIFM